MRKVLPLVLLLVVAACSGQRSRYVQISGYAQGGTYTIKLNLKGVDVPVETIRDSIDALLLQIDTTLSGYNKRSLVSRFNAGQSVPATMLFTDMYGMAYEIWKQSEGVVDCAAGPLYDAWGFGFKESRFPTDEEVKALRERYSMRNLPEQLPVTEDGMVDPAALGYPQLNYNAIAQGFSCDIIARYLYGLGVRDMLVDIGEIWCEGLNPAGKPWSVGIDRPVDEPVHAGFADLDGVWESYGEPCGIVTSGNYRKFYIKDGKKYAHTINPLTGYPVQHNLLSATIVSWESAAAADAVATWCMVIGLEAAQDLIMTDASLACYLIYEDENGEMKEWASPGFTVTK